MQLIFISKKNFILMIFEQSKISFNNQIHHLYSVILISEQNGYIHFFKMITDIRHLFAQDELF